MTQPSKAIEEKLKTLSGALEQMASSMLPETEIARIRSCVVRIESALAKAFGVKRA